MAVFAAFAAKYSKSGLIFLLLAAAVLVANRNHLRINENINYDDAHFDNYYQHATYYSEFASAWRAYGSVPEKIKPQDKYKVLTGSVSPVSSSYNSKNISVKIDVKSENALVRINKGYFPEMIIKDNDVNVENFTQVKIPSASELKEGEDPDNVGLPILELNKGIHTINVKLEETNIRKIANLISLISFLLILILLIKYRNAKI